MVVANLERMDLTSLPLGLPVNSIILSNWFMVDSPGKRGCPPSSSPKMHPIDHMSTPFVYLVEPSRISGALYQRVATYSVNTFFSSSPATLLANPKSQILTWQSEFRRTLEGFMSLCRRSPLCMYLSALMDW